MHRQRMPKRKATRNPDADQPGQWGVQALLPPALGSTGERSQHLRPSAGIKGKDGRGGYDAVMALISSTAVVLSSNTDTTGLLEALVLQQA